MKKTRWIGILVLAAVTLSGCEKAVWKPLWSTPMPGRTPAVTATAKATATPAAQGESDYFTTDAEKMDAPRVVVNKGKRTLELYDGKKLMARMKVALGPSPEGPKLEDGDDKTPEGDYYICARNGNSKFHKSLCINYPNEADALRGLDADLLNQAQYGAIAAAADQKKTPLWNTKMGGEIAIHGHGTAGKDKTGDWTAGNIAVTDAEMDYLWKYVVLGVEVQINP